MKFTRLKLALLTLTLLFQASPALAHHSDYEPIAEFTGTIPGNLVSGTTDGFGSAVKLNGDWAFVSAPIARPFGDIVGGAVYVYKKNCHGHYDTDPVQIIELPGVSHHLGLLKVESQGDWLFLSCIGTPVEDVGLTVGDFKGAVLIYKYERHEWQLQQSLDSTTVPELANLIPISTPALNPTNPPYNFEQGASFGLTFGVDVDAKLLVVGAQYQTTNPSVINVGAAYAFKLRHGRWEYTQTITNPQGQSANDTFGSFVAVNGKIALISNGSIFQAPRQGNSSVYVYAYDHGEWEYRQTVTGNQTNQTPVTFVLFGPSTLQIGDTFGSSLALNDDWAVIAAGFDNNGTSVVQGSAYFYRVNKRSYNNILEFDQKVVSTDVNPVGQCFGFTGVAIHGDTAVISNVSQTGPTGILFQGGANVYKRKHGNWNLDEILFDPQGENANFFGAGVDIDKDHIFVGAGFQGINMLIVGTPPLVFLPSPPPGQPPFRNAVIYKR